MSRSKYNRVSNMWTHTQQVYAAENITNIKTPRPLKSRLRKEIKATKMIVFIFLAFCLCWLPATVFTAILYIDENYFLTDVKLTRVLYVVFVDVLPTMNTMVNPVIYSFSNTQFTTSLQHLWRRLKHKTSTRWSAHGNSYTSRMSSSSSSTTLSSRMLSIDNNIPTVQLWIHTNTHLHLSSIGWELYKHHWQPWRHTHYVAD